jgi:hypothetical protein
MLQVCLQTFSKGACLHTTLDKLLLLLLSSELILLLKC